MDERSHSSTNIHGPIKYVTSPFVLSTIKLLFPPTIIFPPFFSGFPNSLPCFASHKKPFSHSPIPFSTFMLFHSHFFLPSFMLGGHSPVKEFNMQLLYEKPIAYVWVYWARNLSARTANAIERAGAIYHTGSYLFLSLSLPLSPTLPSLSLSLFKPRFLAATKSGQL